MLVTCVVHEPIHYLLARRVLLVELDLLVDEFGARLGYLDVVAWAGIWRKVPLMCIHS